MAFISRQSLRLSALTLATTMLGGCFYGDLGTSSTYAFADGDCSARYGDAYYDGDPYAYNDGYGYDCYDGADYGGGFVQIGFGGGWYDNLYYPGYGVYLFDNGGSRYAMRRDHLNYWGGRRAWWKHHGRDGDHRRGDGRHDDGDRDHGDRAHGYGGQSQPATIGAPANQPTPRPRQPGPDGDFQPILAGGARDRDNDGVPDRRGPRGGQTGGHGNNGNRAPVVAPAIQELPVPSPAPQAVRPGRSWAQPAIAAAPPVAAALPVSAPTPQPAARISRSDGANNVRED